MARPSKYDWVSIKTAYVDGIDTHTIVKKYKISKKTLANKISSEKWSVTGELNSHVEQFEDSLRKISQNTKNDPIKQQIALDKINTILEDNNLVSNNRKLLKGFQGLIAEGMKSGSYKTAQDIKAGVSSIKDIESIANPQRDTTAIQVNNNLNNEVTEIEVKFED